MTPLEGREVIHVWSHDPDEMLKYHLACRDAWRADSGLPYARTVGGAAIHRPDCHYITNAITVAECCITQYRGGPKARGNTPYPVRISAPAPTCRVCLSVEGGA